MRAGLGIDNNGQIFAAIRSIVGEGGGMFRSTDNGDSWTEQNSGFTAFDVNAVTFNSVGQVFVATGGVVFRSTNDGASWTDISSDLIPVGGNVWALAIDSRNYAFAGTAGGGVFRSITSGCECFRARHLVQSLCHSFESSMRCDDWLTAIDHCTRKLLRNLSETE